MAFTPIDDDGADKFGDLGSVETFQALAANANALIRSMPIGAKVMILVGLPGVPDPDPSMWLPCEGDVVTDPNSLLRDQAVPDDRNLYPKGCTTLGTAGMVDGSHTRSFAHSHGGVTGEHDMGPDNSDTDDDYITVGVTHHHGVDADLTTSLNVEPVHIKAQFYVKIR